MDNIEINIQNCCNTTCIKSSLSSHTTVAILKSYIRSYITASLYRFLFVCMKIKPSKIVYTHTHTHTNSCLYKFVHLTVSVLLEFSAYVWLYAAKIHFEGFIFVRTKIHPSHILFLSVFITRRCSLITYTVTKIPDNSHRITQPQLPCLCILQLVKQLSHPIRDEFFVFCKYTITTLATLYVLILCCNMLKIKLQLCHLRVLRYDKHVSSYMVYPVTLDFIKASHVDDFLNVLQLN